MPVSTLENRNHFIMEISDSPAMFMVEQPLSPCFKPSSVLYYHKLGLTIRSKLLSHFVFQTFCCKETNAFRRVCCKDTQKDLPTRTWLLWTHCFPIYSSPFRVQRLDDLSVPLSESKVTFLSLEKLTKGFSHS